MLRIQAYFVSGLRNYLQILSPQHICTSEGYKVNLISNLHGGDYILGAQIQGGQARLSKFQTYGKGVHQV